MTQREIDREVAEATGESIADVRRHGFSLWEPPTHIEESEMRHPLTLNWDNGQPGTWPLC